MPESWVRREKGWAAAKGHLFLLSHIVALDSRTVSPKFKPCLPGGHEDVFQGKRIFSHLSAIADPIYLKYLKIWYMGLHRILGSGTMNVGVALVSRARATPGATILKERLLRVSAYPNACLKTFLVKS